MGGQVDAYLGAKNGLRIAQGRQKTQNIHGIKNGLNCKFHTKENDAWKIWSQKELPWNYRLGR